jgi:hypothetical protein
MSFVVEVGHRFRAVQGLPSPVPARMPQLAHVEVTDETYRTRTRYLPPPGATRTSGARAVSGPGEPNK